MRLDQLRDIVSRCTQKGCSDVYRNLYQLPDTQECLHIESWEQWHALPPITRDYLSDIPFQKRIMCDPRAAEEIHPTSGTSGRKPLFTAHGRRAGYEFLPHWHTFTRPVLCSYGHFRRLTHAMQEAGSIPRAVITDPRNMRATIILAKAVGVDSVVMNAAALRFIGDEMMAHGLNKDIVCIDCGGAFSEAMLQYMHTTFPHALTIFQYGAGDVESAPIGIPCRATTPENPKPQYHANRHIHLDIVDPDTGAPLEPRVGIEGDLLVTSYIGEPAASPSIRYRIGDRVRVVEERCKEHDAWSFTVLGRSDADFAKIPGGLLRADEVERVVQLHSDVLTAACELHYHEVATPTGPRLKATLYVEPRDEVNLEQLASAIAQELRTGPKSVYATGVTRGWYFPLECAVYDPSSRPGKPKRLVKVSI